MALIIKRYEAQSQSVSPSVKQRRSAGVGGPKSPSVQHEQLQLRGVGGGRHSESSDGSKLSSVVSPNRLSSVGVSSNTADKMERMEKGMYMLFLACGVLFRFWKSKVLNVGLLG